MTAASTAAEALAEFRAEMRERLQNIEHKLELHITADAQTGQKTEELYKVIIVGNGVPSHRERLRTLERWQAILQWAGGIIGGVLIVDFVTRLLETIK